MISSRYHFFVIYWSSLFAVSICILAWIETLPSPCDDEPPTLAAKRVDRTMDQSVNSAWNPNEWKWMPTFSNTFTLPIRFETTQKFFTTLFVTKDDEVSTDSITADDEMENKIAILYNLYVGNPEDVPRVSKFVTEQLELRNPEYHGEVFLNSIGVPAPIPNTTLLQRYDSASELVTLHALWEYCRFHRKGKVIYLHSKGSFNSYGGKNDLLRLFLTRGALSEECATLPADCNVCSSRMSPLPHPHTPGNMWLARCEYIQRLSDPTTFSDKMEDVKSIIPYRHIREQRPACFELKRFAAEHWVHSHPTVQPCDLYDNAGYLWGYDNVPATDFPKVLQPAPRFPLKTFLSTGWHSPCLSWGAHSENRLKEYTILYNMLPSPTWWGWKYYG